MFIQSFYIAIYGILFLQRKQTYTLLTTQYRYSKPFYIVLCVGVVTGSIGLRGVLHIIVENRGF